MQLKDELEQKCRYGRVHTQDGDRLQSQIICMMQILWSDKPLAKQTREGGLHI